VASGRPSRTGQDEIRNARGVSESSSVAWATVRDLYPTNIVAVSGGHGDMDTVMVRVPDELAVMPSPDDGDELM